MILSVTQLVLVGAQVVVEQAVDRVAIIAVQVDQCLEALLGALEEPVDRAFLVGLQVCLVEIIHEIFADLLTDGFLEEAQVFFQGFVSEGGS